MKQSDRQRHGCSWIEPHRTLLLPKLVKTGDESGMTSIRDAKHVEQTIEHCGDSSGA